MLRIVEMELRQNALKVYEICHATEKALAVHDLTKKLTTLAIDCQAQFNVTTLPGRPDKPDLVQPQKVPRRSPYTPVGHAALMHSIAHIEFNAIDLALDAVWRFADMPEQFYLDWMKVADEEAKHFLMLQEHLNEFGFSYGDFTAHDGLWTLCYKTRNNITERMALIPRTLEARGLDATPVIQEKLHRVATSQALKAIAILDVILQDEVGHVSIGNHWYQWLCEQEGLDAQLFATQTSQKYDAPVPKPPFNYEARRQAGFTMLEIAALSTQ